MAVGVGGSREEVGAAAGSREPGEVGLASEAVEEEQEEEEEEVEVVEEEVGTGSRTRVN